MTRLGVQVASGDYFLGSKPVACSWPCLLPDIVPYHLKTAAPSCLVDINYLYMPPVDD